MDPFFIFPLTIFIVSMTAFWNHENMVKKDLVKSEKRFVMDQSVYQCEQRQTLTTRMPQDYGLCPNCEPKIIYVEKPSVKPKRPLKPKPQNPCEVKP